jgi:hypothetical protein
MFENRPVRAAGAVRIRARLIQTRTPPGKGCGSKNAACLNGRRRRLPAPGGKLQNPDTMCLHTLCQGSLCRGGTPEPVRYGPAGTGARALLLLGLSR